MARTVYNAICIPATIQTDRAGTYNFLNYAAGTCIIQTAWMDGSVTEGVPFIGIRSNSGNLGFLGELNAIGPPPNDYNQKFTSTNTNDSSGFNYFILPYQNHNRGFPLHGSNVGLLSLRNNGLGNGNYGTATLSGGTVTINTTLAATTTKIFVCNATTSVTGPNPPGTFGNVWVSSIIPGLSFTVSSTEPSAQNNVNWFILNTPSTVSISSGNANVILDRTVGLTQNYGVITMASGNAVINRAGLSPTSVVYVSTLVPDITPGSRGYIMSAVDSGAGHILFWSSNATDGQTFAWWLLESAIGIS